MTTALKDPRAASTASLVSPGKDASAFSASADDAADTHAVPAVSRHVVMVSDPDVGQAEAIRALRTHVLTSHLQRGRRALVVCAPSAEVGCSFVAVNLAVALAQIGLKVLLIDGDLRRPSLRTYFPSPAPAPGLYECLRADGASFTRGIVADHATGLSIMYAGEAGADAPELLSSDRFKTLMDFCLRQFEVTIIDTPPANSCSDARLISSVVGYSLIVTRRNHSFVADVKTLADELRQDNARVIGTVLNEA